jgi:formylmethanofuran dehydrogenase subunit E-like metal-binding protein
MVVALVHKLAFSGFAAAIAASVGLVNSASVEPVPAYGAPIDRLDATIAASQAERVFNRADLDNDGSLSQDEYTVLAVVSAELARLNGFVAIDISDGVRTVAVSTGGKQSLSSTERARINERATREFRVVAGDDERLASDEYITAQLEQFLSNDLDRNGVLTGSELATFALAQSKISFTAS